MSIYSGTFETSANKDATLDDRLRRRKAKGSGKLKGCDKPPQILIDVENEITHLIVPEVYLTTGIISLPFISKPGKISQVARVVKTIE